MNIPETDRSPLSWQQLLSAYVDGELDPAARRRFQLWLDEHPDVREKLEAQQGLSRNNDAFREAIRCGEPCEASWTGVWNRIESQLDGPRHATASPRHGPWWRRGLVLALLAVPATAAAAVVLAVCLPPRPQPSAVNPILNEGTEEVFQVAIAGDVEILSVREADVPHLVVGEAPFNQPMTLVVAGDVRLDGLQPAGDGMMPEVQMGGGADAPMIYAPVSRTP